jgi:LacI family transcriptional regulator
MVDPKRATIDLVAREAGVSAQTVSRVLNNRPDVSPATRARIKEIMQRMGYQPNAMARSLASRRTRTLGLITDDFSDYFFAQVIAGAEEEARRCGYLFMLGSTEKNPQDEPEYIRLFSQRHVEGFLFAHSSTGTDNRHLADLIDSEVPVVTASYHVPGNIFTVVDVDNMTGGQQAAHHLLEQGHTNVAMIKGPAGWKSVTDRAVGFEQALRNAGFELKGQHVAQGDWSYVSGYRAMCQILEQGQTFTALFAHNDQMAIGAMRATREAGIQIPQDLSVVGYDDIPAAEYADPPLTTIRQPMREVGATAARLLIERIEQAEPPNGEAEVLLSPELIQRASSASDSDGDAWHK